MEVRSETIISWSWIKSSGKRSFHVCKIADSVLCSAISYQDTCPLLNQVFTCLNLMCCHLGNSRQFGNVRQLTKEPSGFGTGVPSQSLHRFRVAWNRRRQWHPTPVLLPGNSHGQRSLVGCSPWGHWELDMPERLHFDFSLSCIGEGNGNPLQCSCLETPRDGGAWWAAIYEVAQSQTRLKWLSSSSRKETRAIKNSWI